MQTLIVFVVEKHSLYPGMQPEILWAGEVLQNQGTSINLFPKMQSKKVPWGKSLELLSPRNT